MLVAASTRSGHPTFDAWLYTMHVESAVRLDRPLATPELWHPHHLVYEPLGVVLVRAVRAVVPSAPALTVLQLLSAAAGGLALWAFAKLVAGRDSEDGQHSNAGLVPALLLGASFAFWYYAGEAEVYVPALACALTACDVLVRSSTLRARRLVVAAVLLVVATLFHQMIVLLAPAVLLWLWRERRAPGAGLLLVSAWGGLVLAVYGLAWSLAARHGVEGAPGFWGWITYYAHAPMRASQGWGHPGLTAPLGALVGLVRSLLGGHVAVAVHPEVATLLHRLLPGAFLSQEFGIVSGMPRVVSWTVALAAIAAGVLWLRIVIGALRRPAGNDSQKVAFLFALWAVSIGGFTLWWEADNLEFWLLALPGILGWIFLRQRHRLRGRWAWTLVVLFAFANFAGSVASKRWGPGHHELALFARAAALPSTADGGRLWADFANPYLPGQVLAPLWRMTWSPHEDLSLDLEATHPRIWILPDSTVPPHTRLLDSCPGWQVHLVGEGAPGEVSE